MFGLKVFLGIWALGLISMFIMYNVIGGFKIWTRWLLGGKCGVRGANGRGTWSGTTSLATSSDSVLCSQASGWHTGSSLAGFSHEN